MGLQLYLPWGDFIERQLVPGLLNKGSEGRLDGSWKSVQITERAHVRVRLSIRPQPFFTGCLSVSGMVLSAATPHRAVLNTIPIIIEILDRWTADI